MASFQSNAQFEDLGLSISELMADPERRALSTSRFWGYVDSSAGEGGCWPFDNSTPETYGSFKIPDGGSCGAHRFSYFLSRNAEPKGVVMHLCDNRRCVNPIHLRDGTQKENMLDARRKGRLGKRRPREAKDFSPQMEEMLSLIANRLGVSLPNASGPELSIPPAPPRANKGDVCTLKNLRDANFWPKDPQRRRALELIREKTNPRAVHCLTGVPVKTLQRWRDALD